MIVRSGSQTFEFQEVLQLPKPLNFDSFEDALKWLKRLWSQDPNLISRFREYVARYSGELDPFRLTDDYTIERLALLLQSRRIVVLARETLAGGGAPAPKAETAAPAFPLSERKPRAASVYSRASAPTASSPDSTPPPVLAPLWIRLDLTPKQAAKETGSLRLIGSSGYDKTVAIASNFVPNEVEANTVDVLFENVPTTDDLTLTHIDGDGTKTTIVKSAPFDSLKDESMAATATETETQA